MVRSNLHDTRSATSLADPIAGMKGILDAHESIPILADQTRGGSRRSRLNIRGNESHDVKMKRYLYSLDECCRPPYIVGGCLGGDDGLCGTCTSGPYHIVRITRVSCC